MESLVDIVTTSFQAVLAIAIVFTAGYVLNSKQDAVFAGVSTSIAGMAHRLLVNVPLEPCIERSETAPPCVGIHNSGDIVDDMENVVDA